MNIPGNDCACAERLRCTLDLDFPGDDYACAGARRRHGRSLGRPPQEPSAGARRRHACEAIRRPQGVPPEAVPIQGTARIGISRHRACTGRAHTGHCEDRHLSSQGVPTQGTMHLACPRIPAYGLSEALPPHLTGAATSKSKGAGHAQSERTDMDSLQLGAAPELPSGAHIASPRPGVHGPT